jgi:hypothetical protein
MHTSLSTEELQKCWKLGEKRTSFNRRRGIPNDKKVLTQSDGSIDFFGVLGEYVVRRELSLPTWGALDTEGADHRGDILLPTGEWVEVKFGSKPMFRFAIEGTDIDRLFPCEFGVLVVPVEQKEWHNLNIVGWCSNWFFRRHGVEVTLRQPSLVLEQSQMVPFERFQLYLDLSAKIEATLA